MNNEAEQLKELGLQQFQKNQFKLASESFQKCVSLLENEGMTPESAEMRNNQAVALVRIKSYQEALEALQGTPEAFHAAGDLQKEGMAFANLGNALEGLKDNPAAIEAYEKSIECFKSCGEKKLLSITLKYLSDLQMRSGKQYQALASLQSAYEESPDATLKTNFFKRGLDFLIKKVTRR
jgi:tetratricopeptide (TPR) repeat protein